MWNIWKARNTLLFEQHETPAAQIYSRSIALVTEFLAAPSQQISPPGSQFPAKWSPPPSPRLKITVDGAWKNQEAAIGIIVRDSDGAVIHSVSSPCSGITDVEHIELQAYNFWT